MALPRPGLIADVSKKTMRLRHATRPPILALTLFLLGCGKEEKLPQIFTTHWEMPDAVQVKAQFKQFAESNDKGRTRKRYTFTILAPEQYAGKEVSFEFHWKESNSAKLVPGKKYLVTVPKGNIGTTDLVCGWGLEYKEPK